jgi:hypothetical protein
MWSLSLHDCAISAKSVASVEIGVDVHSGTHLVFELSCLLDLLLHYFGLLLLFELSLLFGQPLILGLHCCTLTACLSVETLFHLFPRFAFQLKLLPELGLVLLVEEQVLEVHLIHLA